MPAESSERLRALWKLKENTGWTLVMCFLRLSRSRQSGSLLFKDHRITGWARLEDTTEAHLVQPPCSRTGIWVAQYYVQTVLEYLQGGRLYNLCG